MSVVLYGCVSWEESRLRAFENGMPSKIFWPKLEGVKRRLKKLHKAS